MIRFVFPRLAGGKVRRLLAFAIAFSGSVLLTGCLHPPVDDSARIGPFFTPRNFSGDAQLPPTLRRVVLLPTAGGSIAPPESVTALDKVFIAELQGKNRFEVVTLTRADCLKRFQAEEFSSVGPLPANLMTRLQSEFGADAVMFLDLTVFKPYRPLALGVRAKLATTDENVRLVWTFDNVYSAADAAVANSARNHFLESDGGRIPADLTPSVLQSPARFASYVGSSMFSTLPPVYVGAQVMDAK